MPTIPSYTAKVPLDPGSAPRVNIATHAEQAAAAQGAALQGLGQTISRGAQALGNEALQFADHLRKREEQDEDLKARLSYDGFRRQQSARLQDAQDSMPADGSGFQESFLRAFEKDAHEFTQTLPPRLREKYGSYLVDNERISFASRAGHLELEAKRGFARTEITNLHNRLSADIQNNPDPDAAEKNYGFGKAAIDESRLVPEEKAKLTEQWRTAARSTELAARYPNDPEGLAKAIGIVTPMARAQSREQAAVAFFTGRGLSPVAAAALVGRLSHESGMDTEARNPGDGSDGSDSIGLAQWNADRAENLKAFARERGKPPSDFQTQLEFAWAELNSREGKALSTLR